MKRFISLVLVIMCLVMCLPINAIAYSPSEITRYSVLVLDISGIREFYNDGSLIYTADSAIDYVKESADNFLSSLLTANGKNYVSIVTYSETSQVLLDFTDDINIASNAVKSLSSDESITSNISAGLNEADVLIKSVDDKSIKNVILVTTGMTNIGSYSYNGHYNSSTIGSDWRNTTTQVRLYAYANIAYDNATRLKENANLYVLGIFQTMQDMPEKGKPIAEFFKLFCKDIASSEDINYAIEDPTNMDQYFDDVADKITDTDSFNGHKYQLFDDGLTWSEAKTKCESLGGHLATITSADEQAVIERLMKSGTRANYWLGGSISNKNLTWVTGEEVTYTNWASGQPDNDSYNKIDEEDSLMIYRVQSYYLHAANTWNDLVGNCSESHDGVLLGRENFGYICEWDPEVKTKTSILKCKVKLSSKSITYSGKAKTPKITVTYNGKTLVRGKDYTAAVKDAVKVGKASLLITGIGDYTGNGLMYYYIVPVKPTISKVTSTVKKKMTVKWKKNTTATGYQIQVSMKKNFSTKKSYGVSKNSTVKGTISKLTSGKTYYVRMRCYKTIDGIKRYSAYSAVKSIKVK